MEKEGVSQSFAHVNGSTSYSSNGSICSDYQKHNYSPHRSASVSSSSQQSDFFYRQTSVIVKSSMEQEYSRYRHALHDDYTTKTLMTVSCYSNLIHRHENEYSRYRDARSVRKKSFVNGPLHHHCRSFLYNNEIERFPIPDTKVYWHVIFPDYEPKEFTTDRIQRNIRADPCDPSTINKFNQLDNRIDRRSFTGPYHIDPQTNRPQNPIGRTGVTGRGRLYYWGPNHAGDPVVTRWCRDNNGKIIYRRNNSHESLKPVLEFVAIQRKDTGQWALPGGMVDPDEDVCQTIKREFQEEAVRDGIDKKKIDELFSHGEKLFEWYVDDPRNTDNAWLETVAMHFHDETGELTKDLHLCAGDDAEKVVWCPIDRKLQLYASHKDILRILVDRLNAFW